MRRKTLIILTLLVPAATVGGSVARAVSQPLRQPTLTPRQALGERVLSKAEVLDSTDGGEVQAPTSTAREPLGPWRRTRNGWEKAGWLEQPTVGEPPPLHPLVLTALEVLLALMGCLAVSPRPARPATN